MKSIMISIKPKWCAKIMNGEKTIEVRKNKALANAIQKLIDENGYADIYVYCSKDGYNHLHELYDHSTDETLGYSTPYYKTNDVRKWRTEPEPLNGKVVFKFRCYKIDDYVNGRKWSWKVGAPMWGACNDYEYILKDACLNDDELRDYSKDVASLYCIHISHLEIFDRPKELSEFNLTKAPQNFCYVGVE